MLEYDSPLPHRPWTWGGSGPAAQRRGRGGGVCGATDIRLGRQVLREGLNWHGTTPRCDANLSFRNSSRIHAACCTHFVLLPYRWQFSSDVFSFYRYYVSAHPVLCHEESFYWSTSFYQRHFRVNHSMMLRYIFVQFLVVLYFPENFKTFLAASCSEVLLFRSVMCSQTVK